MRYDNVNYYSKSKEYKSTYRDLIWREIKLISFGFLSNSVSYICQVYV